jgi:hypothetical protein
MEQVFPPGVKGHAAEGAFSAWGKLPGTFQRISDGLSLLSGELSFCTFFGPGRGHEYLARIICGLPSKATEGRFLFTELLIFERKRF